MASEMVNVKPNPEKKVNGRLIEVRHPFHDRNVVRDGEEILVCNWSHQRLRDGDLVLVDGKQPTESSHQSKSGDTQPTPKKKAAKKQAKKTVDSSDSED